MSSQHYLFPFAAAACLCFAASCSSEDSNATSPEPAADAEAGADATDEAIAPDAPAADAAEDAPDAQEPDAGPTGCDEPCTQACESQGPFEGECAACVDTVCAEYSTRAEQAPNRDDLFTCLSDCAGDGTCSNDCCKEYPKACAFEVAYEMCTCGFRETDCTSDCADSCSSTGLSEPCGVCASQSPCTLPTFDYLFAANRMAHQDCVETCMGGSLTLDECLDRCRDDYPVASDAYDGFLACVCTP